MTEEITGVVTQMMSSSSLISLTQPVLFLLYLVCPRESFHTGNMTTGLMAHSRMAKAKANSLALLHICTALFQLVLEKTETSCIKQQITQQNSLFLP